MRLICPNCDAQYEVDERVIPDAGRDVQCSNCGHAWFQHPEGFEEPSASVVPQTDDASEQETAQPQERAADTGESSQAALNALLREDAAEVEANAQPAREEPQPPEPVSEAAAIQEPDDIPVDDIPVSEAGAQRTSLKDDVRSVLQEEASRESRARRGEPESLETQEELGLTSSPAARELRGLAAQERMASLRGLDVEEDPRAGNGRARRDLLPDVEEINSSLSPIGSDDVIDDFAEPVPRKSSFRRGFIFMLLLAVIIVAVYIYAPLISEKVPALASYMDMYVGLINQAREWLDGMVKLALSKL